MIPLVLAVDVEPDGPGHLEPPAGRWKGFVGLHRYLGGWRERIEEATGRRPVFSWFLRMDPQAAEVSGSVTHAVDAHPDEVGDILDRGEPLGLHVHALRRLPGGGWIDDFEDRAWLVHCIDSSYEAFAAALGRPCRLNGWGAASSTTGPWTGWGPTESRST